MLSSFFRIENLHLESIFLGRVESALFLLKKSESASRKYVLMTSRKWVIPSPEERTFVQHNSKAYLLD